MPFAHFEPVHDFASVGAALIGLEPIPGVRLRAADITEAAIQLERGMSGEVVGLEASAGLGRPVPQVG